MQSYEVGGPAGSSDEDDVNTHVKGYYRCLIGLSAVHFFGGCAALGVGIANAIICGLLGSIGYGIWGSIIYFAAGITGIVAAARQTRCTVGGHMVLSIVAAAAAAVQLGMGAGAAVFDHTILRLHRKEGLNMEQSLQHASSGLDYFFLFGCTTQQHNTYWTWDATGPTVTDSLLAAFAIIEGIVAIMSAIYTCRICLCPPGVSLYAGNIHTSKMTLVTSKA
jgi:hypothetical protein